MKTIDEVVAEEIAAFENNGLYWYDGISWLTDEDLPAEDREVAYDRVFAALIENGRGAGMVAPYVHHNGNGHYVVGEGAMHLPLRDVEK